MTPGDRGASIVHCIQDQWHKLLCGKLQSPSTTPPRDQDETPWAKLVTLPIKTVEIRLVELLSQLAEAATDFTAAEVSPLCPLSCTIGRFIRSVTLMSPPSFSLKLDSEQSRGHCIARPRES